MSYSPLCGILVALVVFVAPAGGVRAAATDLAEPLPTFDEPRKIVLQLTSNDPDAISNVLWNVTNLQKFYDVNLVRIAVVAFGPGMEALYKEASPVRERIETMIEYYDVEFVGCGNTMAATGHSPDDLIEGVDVATAGIAEIVERKLRGWIYVRP